MARKKKRGPGRPPLHDWEQTKPKIVSHLKTGGDSSVRGIARGVGIDESSLRYVFIKHGFDPKAHMLDGQQHEECSEPIHTDEDLKARQGKLKVNIDGNYAEVSADLVTHPSIKTLKGLLKKTETDLDEWLVKEHKVNKWDGFYRIRSWMARKKEWRREVAVVPLYQVKARLVRRNPLPLEFPPIQPIKITPAPKARSRKESPLRPKRAVIVGDGHLGFKRDFYDGHLDPFHSRNAFDIASKVIRMTQPDKVIIVGDMLDLPDWQPRFRTTPEFRGVTQPALNELAWWLHEWRTACPSAEFVYLEGNHEVRIYNCLLDNLPAAFGLHRVDMDQDIMSTMGINHLLALDTLAIKYLQGYPDSEYWLDDDTRISHGDKFSSRSGGSVSAVVNSANHNEVFGHCHRSEHACRTFHAKDGVKTIQALTFGCLARLTGNSPKGRTKRNNWQQGLGLLEYGPDLPLQGKGIIIEGDRAIVEGEAVFADPDHGRIDAEACLTQFGSVLHDSS